jgi:hypothetical protein
MKKIKYPPVNHVVPCQKFYEELRQTLLASGINISFELAAGMSGDSLTHYRAMGREENIEKFKAILLDSQKFETLCRGRERQVLALHYSPDTLFGSHDLKKILVNHSILHDAINNGLMVPDEAKSFGQKQDGKFLEKLYNAGGSVARVQLDGQDETPKERLNANRFLNVTQLSASSSVSKTGLELLVIIAHTLSDQPGCENLKNDVRDKFGGAVEKDMLKSISVLYPESKKHKDQAMQSGGSFR